jgi:hypothetical protein
LRKIKIANCKPKLKNHVHDCWQQSMALSQIVTPIPWESIERQVKCDYRFRDSSQMWLPFGASVQWNLLTWKLRFYSQSAPSLGMTPKTMKTQKPLFPQN